MDFKILMLSLVLSSFLFCQETTSIGSSATKNSNLVEEPIIKTIKTIYGSIYDCVDFYKQPAFDHPNLKNHSFHPRMRPSSLPRSVKVTKSSHQNATFSKGVEFDDDGCPIGTVPIRRLSNEDIVQMKRFSKDYASRIKANKVQPQPGSHFAIVQTNSDASVVNYYGVLGTFNIYSLSIRPSQYSAGKMIIQNGEDRVQVGWMINPAINKDNEIHLFQYLNAGQSHCFNLLCPGFIAVSQDIPIDIKFTSASKRGGDQVGFTAGIYLDATSGNWWLQYEGKPIGFWPRQIFSRLGSGATYVAVGGEAYSPVDQPLPPMGNGYYPVEDQSLSAFCHNFTILNLKRQWVDPQYTETYVNDNHYGVYDVPKHKSTGRLVFYGGTTLWA